MITCSLTLQNAGTTNLTDLVVPGQPDCSALVDLAPSESTSCNVSIPVTQYHFNTWDGSHEPLAFSVAAAGSTVQSGGGQGVTAGVNISLALTSLPEVQVYSSSFRLEPDFTTGEWDSAACGNDPQSLLNCTLLHAMWVGSRQADPTAPTATANTCGSLLCMLMQVQMFFTLFSYRPVATSPCGMLQSPLGLWHSIVKAPTQLWWKLPTSCIAQPPT